jgi:hypothetical protein
MEAEYPNTLLRLPSGATIDLRRALGADEREQFARAGLPADFAVLSAYPAPGEQRSAAFSEARTAQLSRVLGALHAAPVPVLASSPDGAHLEPSLAARVERRSALAVARLFDQAALFWFDGERMWIDWTDARPSTALPLRADANPFRVAALNAHVDESGAH